MAEKEKTETGGSESKADEALLKESREGLQERIDAEKEQRDLMLDDLRFLTLDQWPADLRAQRENDVVNGARPCLTVDQINQYTTQVENDMASNRPSIKTRPVDDGADPETAKIFQGLVRHIEDQSSAHVAYQTAGASAVAVGLGFVRVVSEYVSPDSFDQELLIKRVPDTFSVYLGEHNMPDGSDAEKAWVFENVPLEKFQREYPKASIKDSDFANFGGTLKWKTEKSVVVCEYFYKKYEEVELLFLADGTSVFADEYKESGADTEITGRRMSHRVSVKWCKHTGCEVLERSDIPGKYIPIVEEVGKEKIVEGKRVLWGLVRPAKDSLRAFNYWISAMTEKMALAPKSPWVGAVGQFKTAGDKWDKSNVNNYATLEYDVIDVNGNVVPAPRRQEPIQMEAAMAQLLGIMQNNVKSSLGMYKAAVGDTDSQQSGRAILALKKESDTGTSHFGANQAISITHVGRILVDRIPYTYDTKRILRILGEDGKTENVTIDPSQGTSIREIREADGKIKRIYNLGVGKYDVTVTVGPGYTTSRQEAATVMSELAQSAKDPASAAILQYAAVKNADFHGSEEITKMLKAMLPPQIQEDTDAEVPPQAMAKIQQLTQHVQVMQQKGNELLQENQQLKSSEQTAQMKIKADYDIKMKQVALDEKVASEKARLAREEFEFEKALEIDKANHEIAMKKKKDEAERQSKEVDAKFQYELELSKNPEFAQVQALPNVVQAISGIGAAMQSFAESLNNIAQIQAQTLAITQNPPPKQVSLSDVRTDASGRIIGAHVSTAIN